MKLTENMIKLRTLLRYPGRVIFASFLFAAFFTGTQVWGQGFTASIFGAVTDNTGAAVTDAIVSAVNTGTGQRASSTTDENGGFIIVKLSPGQYRVEVEKQGFKRGVRENLTLDVDQRQDLDFHLELGAVSETVAVLAEAPPIQTETATVGGVVTHNQAAELPLNGRNFLQLNLLVPGAAHPVPKSQLSTQGGAIIVHGQAENSNYFWVDGVDNTTQTIGQYVINVPAYSIEEFRVMSPTYDAEFGRTPGANINLITRSGTNSYHGDTYLFLRNSVFDAKNYFDPVGPIPVFRRGQYGGDIGGKIVRDKLFFYGAFEGLTLAQGESAKSIVPTVQETSGNFNDISTVIKDPTNGQPFSGNIIPANRLNATGLAVAALYPAPNNGTNGLLVSPTGTAKDNVFVAKGDWAVTEKDHFSLRFAGEDVGFNQPISQFGSNTNIPGFGLSQIASHHYTVGLSETHLFRPNLITEFRMGWNRYSFNYFPYARYQDWCGKLGILGCDEGPTNWNMPSVSLNSVYASLGGASNQTEPGPFDTTFVDPTVTWIKGKHTLKAGWDWHHFFTYFGNGEGPRGTFTFNGKWTGNPLADLLLGFPFQASKTVIANMDNNGWFLMDQYSTAAFVQDDFRVTPHFTVNLGLRYEYNFPATERRNHMANLDLSHGIENAKLLIEGQNGVGATLYNDSKKQFAPRFGFAFTPSPKWVIRGGYGIFYQLTLENTPQGLHYTVPFSNAYTIVGDGKNITINNALVTGLTANVPAFSAMDQNLKAGMVQQFSLGLQHQLPAGLVLDASFVGTRGKNINNREPFNVPAPGPGAVQARRLNPNYATINVYTGANSTEYDGLEIRLEKRLANGLQFLASYTWARTYDNLGTPQNPYDVTSQWGPANFDEPSHLAFSSTYQLPIGKGKSYLPHLHGVGDAILGGWQINGIFQYHSGLPWTPILATDNTNTQVNQDRPNLVGDPYASTDKCHTRTPTCWANAAAFATPALYTFGTAGKNELRGPTFSQVDASLSKSFTFSETMKLQFRAEAFNLFNHVNYDLPSATLSSTFGVITSAQASRQLQFGFRFIF
jgi:outer membrane receptor protein involved in Fe transport